MNNVGAQRRAIDEPMMLQCLHACILNACRAELHYCLIDVLPLNKKAPIISFNMNNHNSTHSSYVAMVRRNNITDGDTLKAQLLPPEKRRERRGGEISMPSELCVRITRAHVGIP